MKRKKIAIIGAASRLPQSTDTTLWENLLAGRDMISQVAEDRWAQDNMRHPQRAHPGTSVTFAAGSLGDVAGFDAGFFHISPREAAAMDPQQRLLLEMSWEAFAHAGVRPASLRGGRCGVFIGLASTDYGYRLADDLAAIGANSATGFAGSIAANRLSWFYDLQGPSLTVDTACSSALVAFHQACQSILRGESDLALAGAISLHLHPFGFLIFSKASMLSAGGRCRPFSDGADGYVRSEGGGLFLLKDHGQALRDGDRILAVVAHSAVNTDGHKAGLTIPRVASQQRLLEEAYAAAGIDPDQVDYIEAHGTGTAVGDPVEVEAIGRALGVQRRAGHLLPIGSVKSNLGHLETASGVPGLLKVIHCLQQRVVPPTIGVGTLNPRLRLAEYGLEVVRAVHPLRADGPLVAGVNSFGFGGANAHVILERAAAPRNRRLPALRGRRLQAAEALPLMLSAATPAALRQVADDFAGALDLPGTATYAALYQANFRREWLPRRALFRARDAAALRAGLRAFAAGDDTAAVPGTALHAPRGPVFVYSGNGSQWAGMGRALLDDAVFAATLAEIDGHFVPLAGYRLQDDLAGTLGADRYRLTEYAQPALFAVQVGVTAMLRAQGIQPVAVAGHSVGEVAAAWACGSLTLAEAVLVIYERSHLQGRCRGLGQMTAVAAAADEVLGWLGDWDMAQRVDIAAWNSPRGATVVGAPDMLTVLEQRLRAQGTGYKRLDIDYPFHSAQMDALRDALLAALQPLHPAPARIPFVSAVTGAALDGIALDAHYWWRNIREPVRFQQATEAMLASWNIFVEVGGHAVLRGYLQDALTATGQEGRVLSTLRRAEENSLAVMQTAEALWLAGLTPDWKRYFPVVAPVLSLPHYPWERERHWHEVTSESARTLYGVPVHPLLGHPVAGHAGEWEQVVDTARLPFLADHRVGDGAVFPGAAYVELFLAAAREHFPAAPEGDGDLIVEALDILLPLLLDGNESKMLRVTLTEEGAVRIQSRVLLQTQWTLHAKGRVRRGTSVLPEPVAPLPARSPDFGAAQHYRLAERAGLRYGAAFQSVLAGWVDTDTVAARLELPAAAAGVGYLLHPSLLDGAMQLFVDLLADGEDAAGWGYVPVRFAGLTLCRPAATRLHATVRVRRRSPQSILAQLTLSNEQGEVVAYCAELRLRRVRLLRAETERLRYLYSALRPAPRPDVPLPALLPVNLAELQARWSVALAGQGAVARYTGEYSPLAGSLLQAYAEEAAGVAAGDIASADIWQMLVQDYPEFFPITLELGRYGLHQSGRGEGPLGALAEVLVPSVLATMTPALCAGWNDLWPRLLRALSPAQRLAIMEIGSAAAECLPEWSATLGADPRCALYHGTWDDDGQSAPADAWRTVRIGGAERPAVDVIWLRLDVADAGRLWEMLQFAEACLVPGGILLVQGVQPERWWQGLDVGTQSLPGMEDCWSWLAGRGFAEDQRLIDTVHRVGPYALLMRKLAGESPAPAPLPNGDWLLISPAGMDAGAGPELLGTALTRAGVAWQSCVAPSAAALLEQLDALPVDVTFAGILLLPPAAGEGTEEAASALLAASQILRSLGLWSVSRALVPPLFMITAGGITATQPRQNAGPLELEAVHAAGLCGFARSLQNEWPELSLRICDWGVPGAATVTALLRDLLDPTADTELVFDGQGGRYAPQVQEQAALSGSGHTESSGAQQLRFSTPGQLRNLQWTPFTASPLGEHEVEIAVEAVGLNFRDVMYTLGMLADEALENGFSGPGLGLECAGRITATGSGVTRRAVGDRVLGFAPASFSTRVHTPENAVAVIPEGMSMTTAASIPTVFFTAWYALHELARLESGERVLIHGGAGGVGIAAIQIAQHLGARIFATAGSPRKRDFLRLLGVTHIYDSRSLDFAEAILRDTDGEGVDVVLNSLSGAAIQRNLQVLRPFGRFLELGKRDFYENTALGLRPFRNNISYFGVDADQLLLARPALTQRLFDAIMTHFAEGAFFAPPVTRFPAARVVEAFRHMQQARQIGKVVIEMTPPCLPVAPVREDALTLALPADAVYLVTGGLAGFGLETARRLAARGARRLVLVSRGGQAEGSAIAAIAEMVQQGVQVYCWSCDVGDAAQVQALMARIAAEAGPLAGIIHAAAVMDDALAQNLGAAQMRAVIRPKVAGAWHLHQYTQGMALDFFVLYSSITTLLGNPGQAHYVAANTWMEALAQMRRQQGLKATAILWGAIGDAGYLARNGETRDLLQQRLGGAALSAAMALDILERMLVMDASGLVVADLDWRAVRRFLPTAMAPRFKLLAQGLEEESSIDTDLCSTLRALPAAEAEKMLVDTVRREVAQILRLAVDKVLPEQNLSQLGLDSLMGVELALALEERMGVKLPAFLLSEGPTPLRLAQRLLQSLGKEAAGDGASAVAVQITREQLEMQHGIAAGGR
jgi:phthiocerol/phenolphthiocerol synthesis type-I polyketide synthase C